MADSYQLFRLSLVEQRDPSLFANPDLTRPEFIRQIFRSEIKFYHYGNAFYYRPADEAGEVLFGRIGREIQAIENLPPDAGFVEQLHDGWLASVVVVQPEDRGDGQKLAMQVRKQVGATFPILKSLISHINVVNAHEIFFIEIQPIFDAATFWKFAEENKGSVTRITFEFVIPNGLWSTASSLKEELQQANRSTNAQELATTLKSQAGLITDSGAIVEAVEYAEKGSGAISARARNGRHYNSKDKIKKVTLAEEIGRAVRSHLAQATAHIARILGDE